jgi:hypothetical protein
LHPTAANRAGYATLVQVLIETRFSYAGTSGWQSPASQDSALLFEPDRLERRFKYFETITLPSLAAQTDQEFQHLILSSKMMPERYKMRLLELVLEWLGPGRGKVIFRGPGYAGPLIRRWVTRNFPADQIVAQVVLDDDDALCREFVAMVKGEAEAAVRLNREERCEVYLSYPRGLSFDVRAQPAILIERYIEYTNLGLTLVARADTKKNPFSLSHKKVARRHAARLVSTLNPVYLRSVHGTNDSKALINGDVLGPEGIAATLVEYPYLTTYFETEARQPVEATGG